MFTKIETYNVNTKSKETKEGTLIECVSCHWNSCQLMKRRKEVNKKKGSTRNATANSRAGALEFCGRAWPCCGSVLQWCVFPECVLLFRLH